MRGLADSEILLSIGEGGCHHALQGGGITLRATLRALAAISGRYHDLVELYRRIADFDYDATYNLIVATCTEPDKINLPAEPDWLHPRSLDQFFTLVTPQLLTFIEQVAGVDETESAEPSEPVALSELVERLFKIGAGWLEWSPEDTWNATPAEILLARDGLVEKLKAIHGSADADNKGKQASTNGSRGFSAADRDRLNALGNYQVKTMNEVPA